MAEPEPPAPAALPDLPALALLVEVDRAGSIGAAGRRFGITQQAASARLRALERELGVPLLLRAARGSELTAAGRVVVGWADRLLQLGDELASAVEALRADRDRELVVFASMTVAEFLLPGWLVRLRDRQRRVGRVTSVALTAANSRQVVAAVRDGTAQLGFVEGPEVPADLRSADLGTDELVLVVAPDHPYGRRRSLRPAQVAALPLTSRDPGSGTRQVVDEALARHDLSATAADVELKTSTAVRETVRAGGQPGFLSRRLIGQELRAGQLRVIATPGLDLTRHFTALWSGPPQPPAGPIRDLLGIARGSSS
ncbi:LysR family transcriptional regulator [Microlunatus ginsengisoli]|uniref:LysR family transcriptional regulator n=1 Tax=Microlunatus ginsengisoli TaxID=363863 RepID=A0ABP7AUB7_9ACTN